MSELNRTTEISPVPLTNPEYNGVTEVIINPHEPYSFDYITNPKYFKPTEISFEPLIYDNRAFEFKPDYYKS